MDEILGHDFIQYASWGESSQIFSNAAHLFFQMSVYGERGEEKDCIHSFNS